MIDFGVAALMKHDTTKAGSLPFMAPEMFEAVSVNSPSLDVWALGCILFEMVTGHLAFSGSKDEIKRKIKEVDVTYPDFFSAELKELLESIFVKAVDERMTVKQVLLSNWAQENAVMSKENKASLKDLKQDGEIFFRTNNNKKLDDLHAELKMRRYRRTMTENNLKYNFTATLRENTAEELGKDKIKNWEKRKTLMRTEVKILNPRYMGTIGKSKDEKKFIKRLVPMKTTKIVDMKTTDLPTIGQEKSKQTKLKMKSTKANRQVIIF